MTVENPQDEDEIEDVRLTIGLILLILDLNFKTLGVKARIGRGELSKYVNGRLKATRRTWKRIEAATRLPLAELKALLPALRRLRAVAGGLSAPTPRAAAGIARTVASAVESVLRLEEPYLPVPAAELAEPWPRPPEAADRLLAEDLWARLQRRTHSARLALVEEAPAYRSWALAERLCAESERAAADDPREAVHLATLALRVVERLSGGPAWLSLLAGYAWAHIANARRVASDLPGAEAAFGRAWTLWKEGAAADTWLLDGSRLLDLEASLLRDQRHMAAALERLDQALARHPAGAARGRILLKKGATLEQMGRYEVAVEALLEAAPWIDRDREPRHFFGLRFNLTVCLCHTSRFEEAEAGLSELRALTAGRAMDRLRLRWLEGRIDGGRGRTEAGIAALSEARAGFAAEALRYDEALVSLELAVLYLEQGRTAEVKALAGEMAPVFRAQGVHKEAQRALALFRRAVELETVTLALVRGLVAYLYRAQHNPELRFEA
jgi:tetratricopeptide (TPR) repeat protein